MKHILEITVTPEKDRSTELYSVYAIDEYKSEEKAEEKAAMVAGPIENGLKIRSWLVDIYELLYEDMGRRLGREDYSETEAREYLLRMTPDEYVDSILSSKAYSILEKSNHIDEATSREIYAQIREAAKEIYEEFMDCDLEEDECD